MINQHFLILNKKAHLQVILLITIMISNKIEFKSLAQNLPRGALALRVGVRPFLVTTEKYDSSENRVNLSDEYSTSFNGKNLLAGRGGSDLQRMAQEIQRYDPSPNNPKSPIQKLNLGRVDIDAKAEVNAFYMGLAYGIKDSVSSFIAIPFIAAKTQLNIKHSGKNNAQEISDELGDLAYPELKEGLRKASLISTDEVRNSILSSGYTNLDGWQRSGWGDLQWGLNIDLSEYLSSKLPFKSSVKIVSHFPTGYIEKPEILSDLSFGDGGFGLTFGSSFSRIWHQNFNSAVQFEYHKTLSHKRLMRVPLSDETLVNSDRETVVTVNPGHQFETSLTLNAPFNIYIPSYQLSYTNHLQNYYSGDLVTQLSNIEKNTNTEKLKQTIEIGISTVEKFNKNEFPVPFLASFSYSCLLWGKNIFAERYFDLTVTAFLPTPFMANAKKHDF